MRRASDYDLRAKGMGNRDYQDELSRQASEFLKAHKKREQGRDYVGTSKKNRPGGVTAIYVIATGDFVKIGFSKRPVRRLVDMQVGCPMKLDLVAQFDCPRGFERAIETDIHETFEAWQVRGEWFEIDRHLAVSLVARVIELHCRAL